MLQQATRPRAWPIFKLPEGADVQQPTPREHAIEDRGDNRSAVAAQGVEKPVELKWPIHRLLVEVDPVLLPGGGGIPTLRGELLQRDGDSVSGSLVQNAALDHCVEEARHADILPLLLP